MANCICCNSPAGMFYSGVKSRDGSICANCNLLFPHHKFTDAASLKRQYEENKARQIAFKKTVTFSATDKANRTTRKMEVDQNNGLFYFDTGKLFDTMKAQIIYTFDEIDNYELQNTAGETIIKSKGGLTRAAIGGVAFGGAGAIVGASTSKKKATVKNIQSEATITLKTHMGKRIEKIIATPEIMAFLDMILDAAEADKSVQSLPAALQTALVADELLKLKSLLDAGIITQEEFDQQKQKLLS